MGAVIPVDGFWLSMSLINVVLHIWNAFLLHIHVFTQRIHIYARSNLETSINMKRSKV